MSAVTNDVSATQTGQTATASSTSGSTSSSQIGKSEFLELLVAQLKNQDPMNPMSNEQFLTQLATFSSLEQLISINAAVSKLAGISDDVSNSNVSEA
jgi:flagellar basal-body rod modification protein FlgD